MSEKKLKPTGRKESLIAESTIKSFKRKIEKSQKVMHDLFRLENTVTMKNVSWNEDAPQMVEVVHGHFFHTCDSAGKELTNSAAASGHYHEMSITENDEGEIVDIKCSGPKVLHKGKSANYKNDNHTHDISYIISEEVERRVSNADAVRVMTAQRQEERQASENVAGMLAR